jgi:competence ComEA-like helix-hairpin-helix protein
MIRVSVALLILSILSPDLVDINTADTDLLETLPGIGPAKAEAIVGFRETFGPFLTIEDLDLVAGIGPATVAGLADLVTVGTPGGSLADTLHWLSEEEPAETLLTLSILDIGQGDAILIEAAYGETWLFDGGPDPGGPLEPPVVFRLTQLGVDTIDVLAFSHPHSDHIGGLPSVVRRFTVLSVLDPGMSYQSFVYEDLLQASLDAGCAYRIMESGVVYSLSDCVTAEVIHLGVGGDLSVNESSAVMLVSCGSFTALLTGDIGDDAERLLTPQATPVTVLMVPHHGSAGSAFPPYLRSLRPQIAVISSGRRNSFGHPAPTVLDLYLDLGSEILRTDEAGTIVVHTDGRSFGIGYP